jgi:glycosyltransferase involved in cell wall biosynthesis
MKIAFVLDRTEPFYRGGYERRAWELAKILATRHDVTMYTSAPSDQVLENVKIVAVRPQVVYFKPDGFRDLSANVRYTLSLFGLVKSRERFDVVDCNATPFLHIFPSHLLAQRWQSAFVVTAHEALAYTMSGYFRARRSILAPLTSGLARKLYYSSQRLADRLIASSLITGTNLQDEGFDRVDVCTGAVPRCHHPKSEPAGRAVFVGRLVPNKRVDRVLQAFAAARQNGRCRSLAIIGDGPERGRLESLAKQLGISSVTTFHGEVSEEIKWRILVEDSDVFVSASPREGMAIATLEGLAAGNPAVIASTRDGHQQGALEYLHDDYNGVVTDGSIQSLASGLVRVFSDPDRYRDLSIHAVLTAARYTWDAAACNLERIYESAIESRARRDSPTWPVPATPKSE